MNSKPESKEKQEENGSIAERDPELMAWEHERIIVHLTTFERIKAIGKKDFPEMWALYGFYFWKARKDETNQPWALDKYCCKGLGWSKARFYRIKKLLLEHGFIEQIIRRNEDGTKIEGFYVKVNFMNKTNKPLCPENATSRESLPVEKTDTNTLTTEDKLLEIEKVKKNKVLSSPAEPNAPAPKDSKETKNEEIKTIAVTGFGLLEFLPHELKELKRMESLSDKTIPEMVAYIEEYYVRRGKKERVKNPKGLIYEGLKNNYTAGDFLEYGRRQAGYD